MFYVIVLSWKCKYLLKVSLSQHCDPKDEQTNIRIRINFILYQFLNNKNTS